MTCSWHVVVQWNGCGTLNLSPPKHNFAPSLHAVHSNCFLQEEGPLHKSTFIIPLQAPFIPASSNSDSQNILSISSVKRFVDRIVISGSAPSKSSNCSCSIWHRKFHYGLVPNFKAQASSMSESISSTCTWIYQVTNQSWDAYSLAAPNNNCRWQPWMFGTTFLDKMGLDPAGCSSHCYCNRWLRKLSTCADQVHRDWFGPLSDWNLEPQVFDSFANPNRPNVTQVLPDIGCPRRL